MRFLGEHKTALIVLIVGFIIWLLFHYAPKAAATAATNAAVGPTTPPVIQATLSYP